MQILSLLRNSLPTESLPHLPVGGKVAKLVPGKIFQATVLTNSAGGKVNLSLAGKAIEVAAPLQLMAGTKLLVKTEADPSGQLLLKLLTPPDKLAENAVVQQALREHLPRQGELTPLLQTLSQLVADDGDTQRPEPSRELRQIARQILSQLTPANRLTNADQLKQALSRSGQFFEQHLARGDHKAVEMDLKGLLLRLLSRLHQEGQKPPQDKPVAQRHDSTPSPAPYSDDKARAMKARKTQARPSVDIQALRQGLLQGLSRQGESALSRIQMHQLSTLQQQEGADPAWLLELPVKLSDRQFESIKLRIQRDKGGKSGEEGENWSVNLSMCDAAGAPLQATVRLQAQRVSASFLAERDETANLILSRLDELDSRLREQGLEVGHLHSRHGQPARPEQDAPAGDGLLREKA